MAALSAPPSGAPDGPGLLFITSNCLGDAVLSSGVLAHLRTAYPDLPLTVACGALPAPLFADTPGLERLHVMKRRRRGGHWWDLWQACSGRRWAVIADLRGSLIAWTLSADRRLTYRADKRREHRIEEMGRQFSLAALPAPHLWVSDARDRLAARTLGEGPPVLAVAPGANWGAKQWPTEHFAKAAAVLLGPDGILPGGRLAVFGGPDERALAAPVLGVVPPERRLDFTGVPDVLDVFALLRHCSFYFGNDSGPMHMAAAAGIPTLGLFGPSREWRYRPWGDQAAIVRTPESYDALIRRPGFHWHMQDTLMGNLTVDAVVDAAKGLWARTGPNAGSGAFR